MNIHYAYRVAASFDYDRNGYIDYRGFGKEIKFDSNAKRLTDTDRDGHITIHEFAHSLARGDVFIGHGPKVMARSYHQPGYPYPGNPYPGYPPVTYPGPGYGYGYGGGAMGDIAAGAVVGGAIGYIADGKNGLETGAVIGGVIGAIGNLFR